MKAYQWFIPGPNQIRKFANLIRPGDGDGMENIVIKIVGKFLL